MVSENALRQQALDFRELEALADPLYKGFSLCKEDKVRKIRVFSKPTDRSPFHIIKMVSQLRCAPLEAMQYLSARVRRHWDDTFGACCVLKDLGEGVTVTHYLMHSPLPKIARNRDFILLNGEKVAASGGCVLSQSMSTSFDSLAPSCVSNAVRGKLMLSGFVARPVRVGGGGDCELTYVMHVNPMSRFAPPFLVNLVASKAASVMEALQDFIGVHPPQRLGSLLLRAPPALQEWVRHAPPDEPLCSAPVPGGSLAPPPRLSKL